MPERCPWSNFVGEDRTLSLEGEPKDLVSLIGINGFVMMTSKEKIKMIKAFVRVLGGTNLVKFFQENLIGGSKTFYSATHYEFLIDTVEFVKTGKRSVGIQTWFTLLDNRREPCQNELKEYTPSKAYNMQLLRSRDLTIRRWLSHKNGLIDMMYTMTIIFGKYTTRW